VVVVVRAIVRVIVVVAVRVIVRVIVAVHVVVIVVVRVRVVMIVVVRGRQPGDDLDPSLLHAPHGEDPVGDEMQLVGSPAHDHHLEAEVVAQVDVHRGAHPLPELVLQIGQLLAQVAHVMVVDQRQRPDGRDPLRDLGPPHLGARQIAEQLRPRAAALVGERVELTQQRALDRDAEPNQGISHARTLPRRRA
jgi:hypothetical protein